jgi:hypothetical protein
MGIVMADVEVEGKITGTFSITERGEDLLLSKSLSKQG